MSICAWRSKRFLSFLRDKCDVSYLFRGLQATDRRFKRGNRRVSGDAKCPRYVDVRFSHRGLKATASGLSVATRLVRYFIKYQIGVVSVLIRVTRARSFAYRPVGAEV
ncbi:MAG: hypothetical protein OEM82_07875 [Acidobacteriota bacterium]|nr:hypothetical protein [Acidobacteriota bacterium]MDH3529990.1 hypothetical protein [Acidobacteriota bacterium]